MYNQKMLNIRFAKAEEFEEIICLDEQLQNLPIDKIKNKLLQNEIIIATLDNRIIGTIGVEYIWTTRPYIDTLFVDAKYRRQKVASKLLSFLETYLRYNGSQYLYSSAEETANVSINWHEKNGFTQCGSIEKLNLPDSVKEIFFYKKI